MKFLISAVLLLLIGNSSINAQKYGKTQLDSLYNRFVEFKSYKGAVHTGIQTAQVHGKCGFGLISEIKFNYRYFTEEQKKVLDVLFQRPSSDTSFVSPNGFFRIHFTKSDFPDYIPDKLRPTIPANQMQKYKEIYLDSLAIALDSAYNFEVNYLGYPPPPPDGTAGGDDKYDIYLDRTSDYGSTYPETQISSIPTFTSYMEMSDDYSGFPTDGINGARVTAAHEFHHSIQIGDYVDRYDSDAFFYELTSVSMEHFVYPTIHDYYQYLPSYFNNTQNSFTQNGTDQEYALGIWNIFLKDKFGYGIIMKQWELMPRMRAIKAIDNSLIDYYTTFGTEFANFGIWTYFTGYRAVPGKYFIDAAHYPIIKPADNMSFNTPSLNIQGYTEPLTNNFLSITRQYSNSYTSPDSLTVILTNADISKGVDSNYTNVPFSYNLYTTQTAGKTLLTNDYYYGFSTAQPALWLTGAVLNNMVVVSGQTGVRNSDFVFPSPFNYKYNVNLYIPVTYNSTRSAQLYIYNIAMRLVYSGSKIISNIMGRQVLTWNALDNNNDKLSSGVYIYVIKSGDNITKGKLVILNE